MKLIVPTLQKVVSFLVFTIVFIVLNYKAYGQTQANSVGTGVTFQWIDTQTDKTDPATISSITIDGAIYSSFTVPSSYVLTRLGPNGDSSNRISENGNQVNNSSANSDWVDDAIAAFQDKNLNHYFSSSSNGRNFCNDFDEVATTDAQIQSLLYTPGIPSNDGGILAITERNANNCYYISIYGIPDGGSTEELLGDTFVRQNSTQTGSQFNAPPDGVDYWNSGRVVENNGTIGIAIFILDDLAPIGSTITRVDLTGATNDHGDGKCFILQRYAVPIIEKSCMNDRFDGSVNGRNNPTGSTFSLVSGPTPAGQDFTFNTDGSYSYTPDVAFTGDVVFEYQVCLPAPNTSTCDTSTVTLTYETGPTTDCECSSGAADAPMLQN